MQKEMISTSELNTILLGEKLAPYLKIGDVIVLSGDLGAGKTKLVTGILKHFHKENEVSSPTFTIINEYVLNKELKLFHFDVYRFDFKDEFTAIGGEEFFEKGICVIEWGEKIQKLLPPHYLKITFLKDSENENSRKIVFEAKGEKYEEIVNHL